VFVYGNITYINPTAIHIHAILNDAQTGR